MRKAAASSFLLAAANGWRTLLERLAQQIAVGLDLLNPLLLGLVAADQRVDRAKHRIGKVHTLDGIGGGEVTQSGLGAVVIDGVEQLAVALQRIGKADDGLDRAALGEDLGGHIGVHEGHELLGGVLVDGLGGDPELLEPGVAVAVAAFGDGGQSGEAPLEALGAGLGVWGVVNLLEGYGSDNPGANAHVS